MTKFVLYLALLATMAVGSVAYMRFRPAPSAVTATPQPGRGVPEWITDLHSRNPHEADKATTALQRLGSAAIPQIEATLRDPAATPDDRKAALRACGLLGTSAAPAIATVAGALEQEDLADEAAIALSFMGPDAFPPLRGAVDAPSAIVRRESLRSIGKLHYRAGIPSYRVVPLLSDGMTDEDAGVRAVAATYLGILNDAADTSVPLLIEGLEDESLEVRTASAAALGAFGQGAKDAVPALRRAAGDADPDLAREAGRALLKISNPGT